MAKKIPRGFAPSPDDTEEEGNKQRHHPITNHGTNGRATDTPAEPRPQNDADSNASKSFVENERTRMTTRTRHISTRRNSAGAEGDTVLHRKDREKKGRRLSRRQQSSTSSASGGVMKHRADDGAEGKHHSRTGRQPKQQHPSTNRKSSILNSSSDGHSTEEKRKKRLNSKAHHPEEMGSAHRREKEMGSAHHREKEMGSAHRREKEMGSAHHRESKRQHLRKRDEREHEDRQKKRDRDDDHRPRRGSESNKGSHNDHQRRSRNRSQDACHHRADLKSRHRDHQRRRNDRRDYSYHRSSSNEYRNRQHSSDRYPPRQQQNNHTFCSHSESISVPHFGDYPQRQRDVQDYPRYHDRNAPEYPHSSSMEYNAISKVFREERRRPQSGTQHTEYRGNNWHAGQESNSYSRRATGCDGNLKFQIISERIARSGKKDKDGVVHEEENDIPYWDEAKFEEFEKSLDLCVLCGTGFFPIPYPVTRFDEMGLDRRIKIPHPEANDLQKFALPIALRGFDTWVVSETGSGKTWCYAIPAIEVALRQQKRLHTLGAAIGPSVLIVLPSHELVQQVYNDVSALAPETLNIWTSMSTKMVGIPDIAISTIGTLLYKADPDDSYPLRLSQVVLCVLDEVDKIQQANRAKENRANENSNRIILGNLIQGLAPVHQLILLTATLPENDQKFLQTLVRPRWLVKIISGYDSQKTLTMSPYIKHEIQAVPDSCGTLGLRKQLKLALQARDTTGPVLVFCTRADAIETAKYLRDQIPNVELLHGTLNKNERCRVFELYQKADHESTHVFVTTDLLSRGAHNPWTALIINFGPPREDSWSKGDYHHRAGRAGRQEGGQKEGKVITILFEKDKTTFENYLVVALREARLTKKIPEQLIACYHQHLLAQAKVWKNLSKTKRQLRDNLKLDDEEILPPQVQEIFDAIQEE